MRIIETDILLIGGGIMNATLGVLLKELEPSKKITVVEKQAALAEGSSFALHNAGTGHSGFCELEYTPQLPNGTIDTKPAIALGEAFELSRQFYAYLVQQALFTAPSQFINSTPHLNIAWNAVDQVFLRKRYEALQQSPLFADMLFSNDAAVVATWAPLLMKNRPPMPVTATYMQAGTDVNFGVLTHALYKYMDRFGSTNINVNTEVTKIKQQKNNTWLVTLTDIYNNQTIRIDAPFVCIGAGNSSLALLRKANKSLAENYTGNSITGEWFLCKNPDVIDEHKTKAYGILPDLYASSYTSHLDRRIINNEKALFFGPFVGNNSHNKASIWEQLKQFTSFSKKTLNKQATGVVKNENADVENLLQNPFELLKTYVPSAKQSDWKLAEAGEGLQIINKHTNSSQPYNFDTEIVHTADKSLAAILQTKSGASTALHTALNILQTNFPSEFSSIKWQTKLKQILPTWGQSLNQNPLLCKQIRNQTAKILGLSA